MKIKSKKHENLALSLGWERKVEGWISPGRIFFPSLPSMSQLRRFAKGKDVYSQLISK